MPASRSLWTRWKAFARTAARVQSNIILAILYFVVFLPLALIRRPFGDLLGRDMTVWRAREQAPRDLRSARQQF